MTSSDEDSLKRAMNYSYRLLSIKDRSKAEIEKRLFDKGFDSFIIERVVSRLKDSGYIDDLSLAQRLLNRAIRDKNYGRHTIRPYLLSKGIAEETLENLQIKGEELLESALGLVQKKMKSLKDLCPADREKKLFLMLKRRGHDTDTIKRALENSRRQDV